MSIWNRVPCPGKLTEAMEELARIKAAGHELWSEEMDRQLDLYLNTREKEPAHCRCGQPMCRFEQLNGRCETCRTAEVAAMEKAKKPSEDLMDRMGVPPRYRSYTLLNWRDDWQKLPEKLLMWARKGLEPFVVVAGANGTGKTHLGLILLAEAFRAGRTCAFAVARSLGPELMDDARVDGHPLYERLSRVKVLMVDDLKAEPDAAWAQDKVVSLLEARYLAGFRTIITTNVSMEDLLAVDPRLGSRLHEGIDVVLRGPDRRIVSVDEYRQRMLDDGPKKGDRR